MLRSGKAGDWQVELLRCQSLSPCQISGIRVFGPHADITIYWASVSSFGISVVTVEAYMGPKLSPRVN